MIIKWYELDRNLLRTILENHTDQALNDLADSFYSGEIGERAQTLLNKLNDSDNEDHVYAYDW